MAKGNSLIDAAKRMALLMAEMSRLVQEGGNKGEVKFETPFFHFLSFFSFLADSMCARNCKVWSARGQTVSRNCR